ncbi:MAG: LPS export ABC transporter periplasmic protein LptC [Aquificae bacterium]|nr:LPS export ABC transporter periplasmic protein LptC [Aquificota bacterium]
MKSKVLFYTAVFFLLAVLFNQISRIFEGVELKSLRYTQGEIEKFVLAGINGDRYVLRGKRLVDRGDGYFIERFDLEYLKGDEKLYIRSKEGLYRKEEDILDLKDNVKIITKKLILETEYLRMLVKEKRAFNSTSVKLYSGKMETVGENIFIDVAEESLKLENVKTVYKGD